MAKSKGTRILITLECTECRSNLNKRSEGVSRYSTQKNRRNNPERIELKILPTLQQTNYTQRN
jgi:large subunit ribosomal protein L33